MTFPFFIQVNAGDYFSGLIALRKYDAQVLLIAGISFNCISGARLSFRIAFPVIDGTIFHDVLHFGLANLAAFHAAAGMPGIFQERRTAVEPPVAVDA